MAEPKIDNFTLFPFWRKGLVVGLSFLLVFTAIILSPFKSCTALGKVAKNDIYDPSENGAGFVSKADSVFKELLTKVNDTIRATSLQKLNERYYAIEFALPYGEDGKAYIEASDLRVVDIHPEYLSNESLQRFYYNSRLPQLLKLQNEQIGETFFKITSRGKEAYKGTRPIEIASIEMIPTIFKVALAKNPWKGVIECEDNCLFNDSNSIYLSYGNSVLPLHNNRRLTLAGNNIVFNAIMGEGTLLSDNLGPVDYYRYYQRAYKQNSPHSVCINLLESRGEKAIGSITISYSHDTICFSRNCGLLIVGNGQLMRCEAQNIIGRDRPVMVPFKDGMKILVYNEEFNRKYGEFTIQKRNPILTLSSLIQSSMGTSRFYVSRNQTDLFTQQLLRGLSRHLSNRNNIDKVSLTIDPLMSREFENEIKPYLKDLSERISKDKPKSQKKEQYDMSVTIMNLETGEVLATPFYSSQFDNNDLPEALKLTARNTALSRRSIGSVFKPMVALAAIQATPSLLNLNTQSPRRYYGPMDWGGKDPKATFFGRKTRVWAKTENSRYHWDGCDFSTFLGRSDDVYPVALATLAMTGPNGNSETTVLPIEANSDFFELDHQGVLKFKDSRMEKSANLVTHPFTAWLSYLYGVRLEEHESDSRKLFTTDIHMYDELVKNEELNYQTKTFGLQEISPDLTQLRLDRFLDGDDFRSRLVPWVLGQGDNMWNCIKIAEAWSRMVGKFDVKATFIKQEREKSYVPLLKGSGDLKSMPETNNGLRRTHDMNESWNRFLDIFSSAQKYKGQGATLYKMFDKVSQLNQRNHSSLILFGKTGTPDAYSRYEFPILGGNNRYMDVGMYSFALVDSTVYSNYIKHNQHGKGIVCVVRITRSYECKNCKSGKQCEACKKFWGLKSDHARAFFSDPQSNRLQKLYDMTQNYYHK